MSLALPPSPAHALRTGSSMDDKNSSVRSGLEEILLTAGAEEFDWRSHLTEMEFRELHPLPADGQVVYHGPLHTELVYLAIYRLALAFGLKPAQAVFLGRVGLAHDIDPDRPPGTPPRVAATLPWLRSKRAKEILRRWGWGEREIRMAMALIQRTEFPFNKNRQRPPLPIYPGDIEQLGAEGALALANHYEGVSAYDRYAEMLKELGSDKDQSFVLKWGAILSEFADQGSWYVQPFPVALRSASMGLRNEMKGSFDPLPTVWKFLGTIGDPDAFKLDQQLATELKLGELDLPSWQEAMGFMGERAVQNWATNLELYKIIGKGFEEGRPEQDILRQAENQFYQPAAGAEEVTPEQVKARVDALYWVLDRLKNAWEKASVSEGPAYAQIARDFFKKGETKTKLNGAQIPVAEAKGLALSLAPEGALTPDPFLSRIGPDLPDLILNRYKHGDLTRSGLLQELRMMHMLTDAKQFIEGRPPFSFDEEAAGRFVDRAVNLIGVKLSAAGAEERIIPVAAVTLLKNFNSVLVERKTGDRYWVVGSHSDRSANIGKMSPLDELPRVPEPHYGVSLLKSRAQLMAEFNLVLPAGRGEALEELRHRLGQKVIAETMPMLIEPESPVNLEVFLPNMGIGELLQLAGLRGHAFLVPLMLLPGAPPQAGPIRVFVEGGEGARAAYDNLKTAEELGLIEFTDKETAAVVIGGPQTAFGPSQILLQINGETGKYVSAALLRYLQDNPALYPPGTIVMVNQMIKGDFGEALLLFA